MLGLKLNIVYKRSPSRHSINIVFLTKLLKSKILSISLYFCILLVVKIREQMAPET